MKEQEFVERIENLTDVEKFEQLFLDLKGTEVEEKTTKGLISIIKLSEKAPFDHSISTKLIRTMGYLDLLEDAKNKVKFLGGDSNILKTLMMM